MRGHPELVGWQDAALNQAGLVVVFNEGGRELPYRGQIGERLPFAMGPCGIFFGRLMKSAECAWGTGTPLRILLIRSTITVNWASSSCPNSRYSSKSWYGTVAAARWMMARKFAMVALGGGPAACPPSP